MKSSEVAAGALFVSHQDARSALVSLDEPELNPALINQTVDEAMDLPAFEPVLVPLGVEYDRDQDRSVERDLTLTFDDRGRILIQASDSQRQEYLAKCAGAKICVDVVEIDLRFSSLGSNTTSIDLAGLSDEGLDGRALVKILAQDFVDDSSALQNRPNSQALRVSAFGTELLVSAVLRDVASSEQTDWHYSGPVQGDIEVVRLSESRLSVVSAVPSDGVLRMSITPSGRGWLTEDAGLLAARRLASHIVSGILARHAQTLDSVEDDYPNS